MNLYQIIIATKGGGIKAEKRQSFNAFDCIEEWYFDNQELAQDVVRINIEFVRAAQ